MIVLVTGGARSGKSRFSETLMMEATGKKLYMATAIPFDEEMKERIHKHKERRPDDWDTYEGFQQLARVIRENSNKYQVILLDCVTLWLTNLFFEHLGSRDIDRLTMQEIDGIENKIGLEVNDFIEAVGDYEGMMVLVTNEIGMGIVPENKMTRVFRDIQGRVNQQLGKQADAVHLVVCGIPVRIKP